MSNPKSKLKPEPRVVLPPSLPFVVVSRKVLLPGGIFRIKAAQSRSVNLAEKLLWKGESSQRLIGIVPAGSPQGMDAEDLESLHPVGVAARVLKISRTTKNGVPVAFLLVVEGVCRFSLDSLVAVDPYREARVTQLDSPRRALPGPGAQTKTKTKTGANANANANTADVADPKLREAVDEFKTLASELIEALKERLPIIARMNPMLHSTPVDLLCDLFISAIDASFEERLAILDATDLIERYGIGVKLLSRQLQILRTASNIAGRVNADSAKKRGGRGAGSGSPPRRRRGGVNIFGGGGDPEDGNEPSAVDLLVERLAEANLPPEAQKLTDREVKKLRDMERSPGGGGPEQQKTLTYLEWMADLPWNKESLTDEDLTMKRARKVMDDDHFGLEKVKKRVLEYIAVRWIKADIKGSILCLAGPPGVGKTSLGKSIASTLGREFHRISLGGVRDEADIRGFNRTYIGSQPGRLIKGLRDAGTNNPVILLDEIDKLAARGAGLGDPASALLEALDPAQNHTFVDHYINTPFDLSKVMFIATANYKQNIPPALLDRLEVIDIPGYTLEEKTAIATRHLIPKQLKEHGLQANEVEIPEDTVASIGLGYTREAGVRNLDRQIAAICRAIVVKVVDEMAKEGDGTSKASKKTPPEEPEDAPVSGKAGDPKAVVEGKTPRFEKVFVQEADLADYLGPRLFDDDNKPGDRITSPGIVVGLSASAVGGNIMYVEASKMPGSGGLTLTGSLGNVIKESARIALGWIRSHSEALRLGPENILGGLDLHIHFPEGAVGKDGPSGGVALVACLVSLLSGQVARTDTAMTGEVTLSGSVLPVGGIKQKVLAAHRAGISRLLLPARNFARDLADISDSVKKDIEFIPLKSVMDVMANVFPGGYDFKPSASSVGARSAL